MSAWRLVGKHTHFFRSNTGNSWSSRPRWLRFACSSGPGPVKFTSRFGLPKGLWGPLNAACTCGLLTAIGDALAQTLSGEFEQTVSVAQNGSAGGARGTAYDSMRTLRMLGFGFLYGPCTFYWYKMLDHRIPGKAIGSIATKVAANQAVLAPCMLLGVFSWNLALLGKAQEIPAKIQQDLVPSLVNCWSFWVPAATLNFAWVPLQRQVLYMSSCGVLWNAYMSYATSRPVSADIGGQTTAVNGQ